MFFEKDKYYVFVKYKHDDIIHYQIIYVREDFDKCCEFLIEYYKTHLWLDYSFCEIIDYAIVYVDMHMNLTTLSGLKEKLDKGEKIYE